MGLLNEIYNKRKRRLNPFEVGDTVSTTIVHNQSNASCIYGKISRFSNIGEQFVYKIDFFGKHENAKYGNRMWKKGEITLEE